MVILFKPVGDNLCHHQDYDESYRSEDEGEHVGENGMGRSAHFHETTSPADDSDDTNGIGKSNNLPEQPAKPQQDDMGVSRSRRSISSSVRKTWIHKLQRRVPRLYYIATELILPLLLLIGLSFLFGWALANVEMPGEIEANDAAVKAALVSYIDHAAERFEIYQSMAISSLLCAEEYGNTTVTPAEFHEQHSNLYFGVYECSFAHGAEWFPIPEPLDYIASSGLELSFDWISCPDEERPGYEGAFNFSEATFNKLGLNPQDSHDRQLLAYVINFNDDMNEKIIEAGVAEETVFLNETVREGFAGIATGSGQCKVHIAGGALFWFTIMTTIGYGNTAPTTDEGRVLVYTGGFLTIIGFLVLNNTAANVWKTLVDDSFLRLKWKRLVRGPLSVLFWLCTTILWMLVVALSVQRYRRNRIGDGFSLKDAYWFSYITTTTVGFGDIHISHEEFKVGDMFFVPLIVLMSFNFLGIFAEKAVDLHNQLFPARSGFHEILAEQRGDFQKDRSYYHDRSRNYDRSRRSDRCRQREESIKFEAVADC